MKHSSCSPMSETYEVKTIPCNGNWNNILRNLYVDLFNLIVESRIPGINDRGYGNGYHCPPLLGQNVHLCDLMKPECRKHQTMIHHLLRAVRHNIFEIEVLMLPDCCSDSKLSERIQNKEYVLLERWSMTFLESAKAQTSIEIPELLRAMRSFLHFSQISAWLSSTKGKSPANIYYWIKATSDSSSTQFEESTEVHSFPLFKVNDKLCGTVKVNYPTRKQYIPIIPCSKHPPLQGLRLRLTEDSNSSPDIPLGQQIVKQFQKNCDNKQSIIAVKHCATDSDILKTSSTALKSVTHNVNDINKTNIILKHSNIRMAVTNTSVNSNSAQISNVKEMSSNSQASFSNNCQHNYSKCSSQENMCFSKSPLTMLLPSNEGKFNLLNKVLEPSLCETNSVEIAHQLLSTVSNVPNSFSMSSNLCSSDVCNISSNISNVLLSSIDPSQNSVSNIEILENKIQKPLKRKHFLKSVEQPIIPNKKLCMYDEKYEKQKNVLKKLENLSFQSNVLKDISKRKHCQSSETSEKNTNLLNCIAATHFKDDKLSGEERKQYSSFKCIEENSKESSANCSNQTWDIGSYEFNCEKKLKLSNTFVKLKLNNLPAHTVCKNHILNKNSYQNNYFSDCDKLISAKSEFEASKHFCSELNLKSSCNTNETLRQHCKNSLNLSNKTVLDVKRFLQTNIISDNIMTNNTSTMPNFSFINKSDTSNDFKIQKGKIKKRYINNFFKPCRFKKLDLQQGSNKQICSFNFQKKQDNILKLIKTPSECSTALSEQFAYFNIPSTKISNHYFPNTFHKKEKKEIPEAVLRNDLNYLSKSSLLDLTELKKTEEITEHQILNTFSKNQNFLVSHDSKICKVNSLNPIPWIKTDTDSFKNNSSMCSFQDSNKNAVTFSRLDDNSNIEKKATISGNNCSNVLPQKATPYLDCFPRHKIKFARGRKLLGNFEESILKGSFQPISNVNGFHTEIGASGSFCPNHITLPAKVSFYNMDNLNSGTYPYMAHVLLGDIEYYVPKKGAVQITLFNPSETVVKMFVLNYDFSDMPPSCHTFIRQKIYFMPVGSTEDCPSSPNWLRFILHLRFASTKTGKLYLHKDFKIVVLNKSNDDAASEFNQEPRELRSFLHVPKDPTFSNF